MSKLFHGELIKDIYGSHSLQHILYNNLFYRAFSILQSDSSAIYLYENQGWEQTLIDSWRTVSNMPLIGFCHIPIKYWDLRFFNSISSQQFGKCTKSYPDIIAVGGRDSQQLLIDSCAPYSKITLVESLRYQYLDNYKYFSSQKSSHEKCFCLLILVDFSYTVTDSMLTLLREQNNYYKDNLKMYFKPHPLCHIDLKKYNLNDVTVVSKPINEILASIDCVFTSSSSSASLEMYTIGIPLLLYSRSSSFNVSPLKQSSNVQFISSKMNSILLFHP